jgi:hypothetical protein
VKGSDAWCHQVVKVRLERMDRDRVFGQGLWA